MEKFYNVISSYQDINNLSTEDISLHAAYGLTNFNPNLTSHSSRKATINSFAESDRPYYNWSFRVGFETRNLHTIFDYLYSSKAVDVQNVKFLAGWVIHTRNNNQQYSGGHPVQLIDSRAAVCAAELFHNSIEHGLLPDVAMIIFFLHNTFWC